ncbi:MAG: hypothetical protein ABID84_04295 [Chloroflexota bacterium]
MVSGTDFEVLKALGDLGGKAHIKAVAAKAGLRTPYAEMICGGLGRADYMDVSASGTCVVTAKGYRTLRAKGWQSPDDESGKETEQGGEPIGADRFLSGLRQKLERGEMSVGEYQQKKAEIIVRIAKGVEG